MSTTNPAPAPLTKESGLTAKNPAKRRKTLLILSVLFVLGGMLWLLFWWLIFSRRESTDNAYVSGNQVAVSAQVSGTVVAIFAEDTQRVKAGQILVKLDPTDTSVRLAQARAALAEAVRQTQQQIDHAKAAEAGITARQIDLNKAQNDLKRRLPLLAAQAESQEAVQHLRDMVVQAQSALTVAQAQADAAQALVEGVDIANNPTVLQARANFCAAWIALQRNVIYAPITGYIAQRSVQLGNIIQPGQPLMTIIPLRHIWIDANFKESQLRYIHIGQSAKIITDLYGSNVIYHGKVMGLGAGTGSVFSLLPAQNASGNWIKVVQRVPVRISLESRELEDHPLRLGLSTDVTVDISHTHESALPTPSTPCAVNKINFYQQLDKQANAEADAIIRANLSHFAVIPPIKKQNYRHG